MFLALSSIKLALASNLLDAVYSQPHALLALEAGPCTPEPPEFSDVLGLGSCSAFQNQPTAHASNLCSALMLTHA